MSTTLSGKSLAVLAASACVFAASGSLSGHAADVPAGSTTSPGTVKVIEFNMEKRPLTTSTTHTTGLEKNIEDHGPDVVLLSEVCYSDYKAFTDKYDGGTTSLDGHSRWYGDFVEERKITKSGQCAGKTDTLGQAIVSSHELPAEDRLVERLPHTDGGKTFRMLCDRVVLGSGKQDISACVVHLIADKNPDHRTDQTRRIKNVVDDLGDMVLGGDFNSSRGTDAMAKIYATGTGRFVEADRADNAVTHRDKEGGGAKIDYIFFNQGGASHLSGSVDFTHNEGSDHGVYFGQAYIK